MVVLVLPWLLLIPVRSIRILAACAELFFQFAIVGTGNYAWINFVGILPCLAFLDDHFWSPLFSAEALQEAERAQEGSAGLGGMGRAARWLYGSLHGLLSVALSLLILVKSVDPILELFGPAPWLHFYDEYFLVNSQGVFGFINSQRTVLVLTYTHANFTMPASNCRDAAVSPFRDGNGDQLSCAQLAAMRACKHPEHGPQVHRH